MKTHHLSYPSTRRHGYNSLLNDHSYSPELDYTDFCNDTFSSLYLNIISILRWIFELGRINIFYETALLSRYMAAPRSEHLM